MNAKKELTRVLLGLLTVLQLSASVASAQSFEGLTLVRLQEERGELHRLVNLLKRDERQARGNRETLQKNRDNALRFVNGGSAKNIPGFLALAKLYCQSPSQGSLLQTSVPALSDDQFVPAGKVAFEGGDVSQLVEFVRRNNVGLRFGSKAQLLFAELGRDLVSQANVRMDELDDQIELFKAQNIAHTDIMGKTILALAHCRHCSHCGHYGYGCCGHVTVNVQETPPAGLASKAYDVTFPRSRAVEREATKQARKAN